MPFVKRNAQGVIVAVNVEREPGFEEEMSGDSKELTSVFCGVGQDDASLSATDQDFVRVLEDVVQLLIDKGVILFTELPESAQDKIVWRQRLRSELGGKLDLIGKD